MMLKYLLIIFLVYLKIIHDDQMINSFCFDFLNNNHTFSTNYRFSIPIFKSLFKQYVLLVLFNLK